jgi:sulfane dehydrogenase subunit SoxC
MPGHNLKVQAIYDRERAEQHIWEAARTAGMSRRRFLQLMFSTGAGLTAMSVLPAGIRIARADHVQVVKPTPPELFINHGSNREMRWEAMAGQGYYTSNERFFVRNHTSTPHIDPSAWRLSIEGSGVENPTQFTYDDLLAMEEVTETKFIECAGNGRSFFELFQGRRASGTPWKLGAMGVAEWSGVRLRELLERAGVKSTALDVMPKGLDSLNVRRPMPIEKAMEDDTLVVYGMNGEVLPQDHGYPVRMLVPSWVGIANIKWVGSIEVSESPLYSPWNTDTYVLIGDAYPDRPVLTTQGVKSAFELPWGGQISAGRRKLTGRSWSGVAKIKQVEVSVDGGSTWKLATLSARNIPKAWVQWSIEWDAAPGQYNLQARATDRAGNSQPDSVPFNEQGYLYTAVVRHPITVA